MDVCLYWLGARTVNFSLATTLSKWNIQTISDQNVFKGILNGVADKDRHFLMELSEINETKYQELKTVGERLGKKLKFIVFYQTLKPSPLINKLHGAEILLIGPQERNIASVLLKRFFQNADPHFRRWERFQVVTAGTLSLLSAEAVSSKVQLSHFSAHGARIEFVADSFKKKDFVVLEYISHDGKKIRMQCRLVWMHERGAISVGGLQFISKMTK